MRNFNGWRVSVVCRVVMRVALILIALTGWTCNSRREVPPARPEVGRAPPVAGTREGHKGERLVHLSSTHGDTSCLDKRGGTAVPEDLADDDVRTIEALIQAVDPLPLLRIGHRTFGGGPQDGSALELKVTTGIECGALSGHGTIYRIIRVDGKWRITATGKWVA